MSSVQCLIQTNTKTPKKNKQKKQNKKHPGYITRPELALRHAF